MWEAGLEPRDVAVKDGCVTLTGPAGTLPAGAREIDLAGRVLLPGLVNAHDHLDFSTFPALGRPPYPSAYEWAADVDSGRGDASVRAALAVDLADRLFLGGVRNLLAGVTAVAHHNPFHRSLARADFPVRVLARYDFAHSPGLTRDLRATYRTSDRRIPWLIHAAEGSDARCGAEIALLDAKRLLRQNSVLVHAIAVGADDAARIGAAEACVVWCPESNRHLYGATAPLALLRAAGVRIGLGSDSPVSGPRDALSNLAVASRDVTDPAALLELATRASAEVARLPCGSCAVGGVADLIAVESVDDLLAGRRAAVALVLVGGRVLYGAPELVRPLLPRGVELLVDGAPRVVEAGIGRRLSSLLRRARGVHSPWLDGIRLG